MPYRMKPFELGVIVEFYLPKKVSYQGPLHTCLEEALYIDRVRKVLRQHQDKILPTLWVSMERRGYGSNDWDRIINSIPEDILGGWSMYEVDGVFIDRDVERGVVYEERTQVVRLILYPDLEKIQRWLGTIVLWMPRAVCSMPSYAIL